MRLILLATPHHTGTWFWIKFLWEHPEVSGFSTFKNFRAVLSGDKVDQGKKVLGRKSFDGQFWNPNGCNLLHIHLDANSNLTAQKYLANTEPFLALLISVPTVISLRDPLIALITRHHRHPELIESDDLLMEWDTMLYQLDAAQKVKPVCIVPLDLLKTYEEKRDGVYRVCDTMKLTKNRYVENFIINWPQDVNTKGDYPLKQAYKNGDIDYLKENLGPLWGNLKRREDTLRPFLEGFGYKDLLWWS